MLSNRKNDIQADVERQMQEDPAPGTLHYALHQMVDRMTYGTEPNLPVELAGLITDEQRAKYNDGFLRSGYSYLRTRAGFPQGPVLLCRREIRLLEQCLHIASMAYQFHISPRGSLTEKFSGERLREALELEHAKHLLLGHQPLLGEMAGLAALTAHLSAAHDAIPEREPLRDDD